MAFNGSGVYSPPGTDFPAVTQTVISSTKYNNVINDIATALSLCLTKDGQQTATANIPFGGFRATNVGITAVAGSVGTPAINVSDATTGLYRSAVSELAVSIAGTQRARFDSTGLIVTGAASVSTTLTATTSVVTPFLSGSNGAGAASTTFALWQNSRDVTSDEWGISLQTSNWLKAGFFARNDNSGNGQGSAIIKVGQAAGGLVTGIVVGAGSIDSGSTGSLSLKTNNGTEQFRITHTASAVNAYQLFGGAAGAPPGLYSFGSDTDVGSDYSTKGAGLHRFLTNGGSVVQFQVLHTASANRNITVTGSNGGNPTIGVTAGSLAITPSVVFAGATIVQNSQSAAYTTVAADANKHILHPTADNNPRTFTIDSNANVPYSIGTAITFVNQINTLTIAITTDTLTFAPAGTTGSRTLAANGIATALKISATGWLISGTGLS